MESKIVVVVKGIIIFNKKALVVKRHENDEIGPGTWEFVGGKIEFGEELDVALVREVKEEVGIDVSVERLLYATTFKSSPLKQVLILAYKCSAVDDVVKLSEEHTEYMWVTEDKAREILEPAITKDMDKYNAFSSAFGE